MVINVQEYVFISYNIMNFILLFAIFSTCSLIYINSKEKYDIVASTLFLKRNKLKNPFLAGYFGIILLFAGNFLFTINMDIFSEPILQVMGISGLILIFFLIYRVHNIIYVTMKDNAKMYKNAS